jgi:hypothetical protein
MTIQRDSLSTTTNYTGLLLYIATTSLPTDIRVSCQVWPSPTFGDHSNTIAPLTSSPGTTPNIHEVPPGPSASAASGPKRRVTLDEAGTVPGPRSRSQTRQNTGESTRSTRSIPQTLRRMTTGLLTPERKVGKAPTLLSSFRAAAMSSWL